MQEKKAEQFTLRHWWIFVISKGAVLEQKLHKYKGQVVLRGVIVNDDSGSSAIFTEQGASASQMKAAKVMNIISRLPGCAGEAADAVSSFMMEEAPKLLKITHRNAQTFWYFYHDNREKDYSCLCVWTTLKMAGKEQNIDPMYKILTKLFDLGEPTSCLDHVYLGCTQRECETNTNIVDNYRSMFESSISAGATEKNYQTRKHWIFLRGPTTWKVPWDNCQKYILQLS